MIIAAERNSGAGQLDYAVRIQNNVIADLFQSNGGLTFRSNNMGAAGTERLEATVTGNTVKQLGAQALSALYAQIGGQGVGDTGILGLDLHNNVFDVSGSGVFTVIDLDQVASTANYNFPNYLGPTGGAAANAPLASFWKDASHQNTFTVGATGASDVFANQTVGITNSPFGLSVPLMAAPGDGGVEAATQDAPQWQVAGVGDFNGDGLADALVLRSDGLLGVATINGDPATQSHTVGQIGAGWQIAGVGDINGDGTSDILLKHGDGTYQAELIQNNTVAATVDLELVDGELRVATDDAPDTSAADDTAADGRSDSPGRHPRDRYPWERRRSNHPATRVGINPTPRLSRPPIPSSSTTACSARPSSTSWSTPRSRAGATPGCRPTQLAALEA